MYIVTYWLAWSWSKVQFLNVTEPPFHGGLTLMLRESVLITWVPRCPMLTQCQYCALVKHFPRSAMFLCERQAFTSGRASLYVTVDQDIRYRRQSAYKSSHLWLQASKSSRSPRWCGDHFFLAAKSCLGFLLSQTLLYFMLYWTLSYYVKHECFFRVGCHTKCLIATYMLHEGAKDQKILPIYGIDSTSQLIMLISFWLYLWLYDISTICTRTYTHTHTHSYCIHMIDPT